MTACHYLLFPQSSDMPREHVTRWAHAHHVGHHDSNLVVVAPSRLAATDYHSRSSTPPPFPPPYGAARVGAQARSLEMFRSHQHDTSSPPSHIHSSFPYIPIQPLLSSSSSPGRFVVSKAVQVVHIRNMTHHIIYMQLIKINKNNKYCCSSYYIYRTRNNLFEKVQWLGRKKKVAT